MVLLERPLPSTVPEEYHDEYATANAIHITGNIGIGSGSLDLWRGGNAEDTQSEIGRVRGSVTTTLRHGLSYSLAGANLKLKREAQIAETSANDAGEYEFTKLSPGKYTLEASLEGFESISKTITVRAGKTLVENVKLELANQTASVTVTSTAQRLRLQNRSHQHPQTEYTGAQSYGFSQGLYRALLSRDATFEEITAQ